MLKEFTPEVNEDYFNTLSKRISARGAANEGRGRSEALSRNLGGDPYEGSVVGMAREGTNSELNDLDAGLAFQVAGLNRGERLGNEQREDTQAFQSGESEKDRQFRERMLHLSNNFADATRNNTRRANKIDAEQGMVEGAAMQYGMSWLPQKSDASSIASMGAMFSDPRLKTDVKAIGQAGPLTVYAFRYRTENNSDLGLPAGVQIGFMADEVENLFPWAVTVDRGFKKVNYGCLAGIL